ncbi:hypothetical protein HYH03_005600 [Edaphochlamys debaryana]|uniref:MIF4G domain-containing protein n=1 Tax=Edaphochlamys debaryana TaxID=47281 RepID=A0A835Y8W7_9CHLO|nr:hypothetical protein HYH03_005600 [Edaphochlamys debaryana]|eukprot:KAG2496371.1 hypothetical protein HYH03_005600 [Edaphochlamys debaryana]
MAPTATTVITATNDAKQAEAVAACLERLKPGHFQAKRLAFEIRDVGFTPAGSLGTLQQLVRWIYERAVSDPERFSMPCAALAFSLTPILPTFRRPNAVTAADKAKRIDFRQSLLNLCQREFEVASGLVGQVPAAEATEPSSPAAGAPPTSAPVGGPLAGCVQFLAFLYLHHLLTDRIMLNCLAAVAAGPGTQSSDGRDPLAPAEEAGRQRLDCLVRALTIAGRQLHENLAAQHRPVLDTLYDKLAAVQQQAAVLPEDMRAPLTRVLEAHAGGWKTYLPMPVLVIGPPPAPPAGAATTNGPTANGGSCGGPMKLGPYLLKPAGANGRPGSKSGHESFGAATNGEASASASGAFAGTGTAPPQARRSDAGACPGPAPAPSGPSVLRHPLLRRVQGSSGGGAMSSRGSSQNLEGLWNLSPECYVDVKAQMLAQPVATSPATLEAMADELVECAMAAAGTELSEAQAQPPVSAASAGAVAGADPSAEQRSTSPGAATSGRAPSLDMGDADWAAAVQRQWDEQCKACDIYVNLAADAMQHWQATSAVTAGAGSPPTSTSGAAPSCNGSAAAAPAASPEAATNGAANGNGAADTARAFRRLLLSAAQSHFERCLTELLPPGSAAASKQQAQAQSPSGASSSGSPAGQPGPACPTPTRVLSPAVTAALGLDAASVGSGSSTPRNGYSPLPSPPPSSALPARQGSGNGSRRAWGDLPGWVESQATALNRARGICHLLLGLLRVGVLTPRIVLHCAAALVDGAAAGSAACAQCACVLLAGAGKQAAGFKMAEAVAFESLVKRLQGAAEQRPQAAKSAGNGEAVAEGAAGKAAEAGPEADADAAALETRRYVAWLQAGLGGR